MLKKISILALVALSGCAWNAVMTPYAFRGAAKALPADTATIWGMSDGPEICFREIDGQKLPSRGGGGYPISLSLLPGSYRVDVLFYNPDLRHATAYVYMDVSAGHTYVLEHQLSPDGQRVGLFLKDLGATTRCHYERYKQIRGNARLVCE